MSKVYERASTRGLVSEEMDNAQKFSAFNGGLDPVELDGDKPRATTPLFMP
jgi:hypothetical protein